MKLSINDWKSKMVYCVVDALVMKHHCSKENAQIMVDNSTFIEMLDDDPEMTMHYSAGYWAKDIIKENTLVCV